MPQAALLIAHGSRRAAANHDLVELAESVRRTGLFPIVEIAYLELAAPTIPDALRRCVDAGAGEVRLFPYFLSAGEHVVRDLESHRQAAAERFPRVQFLLCPPLGLHPLMIDIVLQRLTGAPLSVTPAPADA